MDESVDLKSFQRAQQRRQITHVGGDRVDIATLVGPGGDVHVYTPSPTDAKKVADARLLVVNGLGLEGWLRFDEANPDKWLAAARGWKRLGARIVMLYPMYRMPKVEDQIATLRRFKEIATAL